VPDELSLVWQCKRRGALPGPGGILDQEVGLLDRMAVCEDAFYTLIEYNALPAGQGSAWGKRNPKKQAFIVGLMYGDN
jgi:hypothetical protein